MRHSIWILLLLFITNAALAEKRIALVIGNSAYKMAPLKNPANDATDMAKQLKASGFQVKR